MLTKSAAPPARGQLIAEILGELAAGRVAGGRLGIRALIGRSVSLMHLQVAAILQQDGPLSMGNLARALDVSVASATGIVDRMEERRLVARRHDERDRRVVEVSLTADGRHAIDAIDDRHRIYMGRLLDELTIDELQHLLIGVTAMRRARRNIKPTGETPCRSERTQPAIPMHGVPPAGGAESNPPAPVELPAPNT